MQLSWPKRNRAFGFVDAMAITGLCGFLVARFVPVARLPFWGCAFRRMTGIPCPGCGLTRVAEGIAHGHFWSAWEANPLGAVVATGFVACILFSVLHLLAGAPIPRVELSRRETAIARVCVVAAVILNYAFMVVRAKFPGVL